MTDPTPVGDLIASILSGYGVARPGDAITLVERWPELAPVPWADRATPVGLHGGILEVEVADGSTASLLRYQEAQLVDHLTAALGAGLVAGVRITVSRNNKRL
jgi:hypothetical protein